MRRFCQLLAVVCVSATLVGTAHAAPITIVAAENFYGDIAQQIGGDDVKVTSILDNPDQDPHLFEASPSVARDIAAAQIVIASGADYDPWMLKLVAANKNADRKLIVVGDLTGKKPGDNPHIWYDLPTIEAFAKTLADDLVVADPVHKAAYQAKLAKFLSSLQPVAAKIAALHSRFAGTPVTATEPVFGYMLQAIGLESRNQRFQLAVMNNTEPSASDVAAFESDLKNHQVKLLVYNSQASDPIAERMQKLAHESKVPVVGATETEPPGKMFQTWVSSEVDAIGAALQQGTAQ